MKLLNKRFINHQQLVFVSFMVFILFTYIDYHISRDMIFIIGLLFFFSGKVKETLKKLVKEPFYLSVVIFFIYILFSIIWSDNFKSAVGHSKTWMTLLVIPFFNEMLENKFKEKLYYVFLPVFFYISVWILLINRGFIHFNYKLAQFDVIPGCSYIMVSFFLGMFFLLTLNKFIYEKLKSYKYFYFALLILSIVEIFMLEGRGGQLAFMAMIFVLIILFYKGGILKGIIISTSIVIFLFLAGYNLSSVFKERINLAIHSLTLLTEKKDYNTSSGSRLGLWIVAKDMILEKPLLGTGVGGYRHNFKRIFNEKHSYMGEEVFKVGYSMLHNEFLQILVQFGIFGFLLYLNIFYKFYKTAKSNGNKNGAVLFLVYYGVFVLTYVALERYQLLYTFVIAMPMIAYAVLCENQAEEN